MEEKRAVKEILDSAEIQEIKEDLRSLKSNVITLANDIKHGGSVVARDGLGHLRAAGQSEFQRIEDHVREKPGQSMVLAFCAGLAFSVLLGSRH
jgi:hypothetical protein